MLITTCFVLLHYVFAMQPDAPRGPALVNVAEIQFIEPSRYWENGGYQPSMQILTAGNWFQVTDTFDQVIAAMKSPICVNQSKTYGTRPFVPPTR